MLGQSRLFVVCLQREAAEALVDKRTSFLHRLALKCRGMTTTGQEISNLAAARLHMASSTEVEGGAGTAPLSSPVVKTRLWWEAVQPRSSR